MINQRLFDHYGINTGKDLKIKDICPRPFDTLLIDKQGSCYACECQAWLPQSVGNLQIKKLHEIMNSTTRRLLQSSMTDGTYRYCNEKRCPHLKHGMGWNKGRRFQLRLAIDDSCNLRCPSCRKDLIYHKDGNAYKRGIRLADRINSWLSSNNDPVQVHIGSDGDPFASHVYRHFMENTPRTKDINYSILTNGLMFKEFHPRIPHVMDNLTHLGVSIDGASQGTYEKLRLGGKWSKILEGLQYIKELKSKKGFEFALHFVVQKQNYHEMEMIIELAHRYKADRLWLNKIEDWQVMDNWPTQDIFNRSHPEHEEFCQYLEKIKPLLDCKTEGLIVEAPRLYKAQK